MLSFCTARDGKLGRNQGMNREWLSNSTLTLKTCHTSLFIVLQMNRWGVAKSEGACYPNLAPWCHSYHSSSLCAVSDGELGKNKGSR